MIKLLPWEGLQMLLRDNDHVDWSQMDWVKRGWFWWKYLDVREEHLGVVLDIGGHIGSWGLPVFLDSACGLRKGVRSISRVVAFEPEEESYNLYVANVALNGFQKEIQVKRMGVAGSDGKLKLSIGTESWGHSTHVNKDSELNPMTGKFQEIEVRSLASVLVEAGLGNGEDVGLMKVNVEGAEFEFIQQAADKDLRRVRHMAIELHFDLVEGSTLEGMLSRLQAAGFKTEVWEESGPNRAMIAAHREGDRS